MEFNTKTVTIDLLLVIFISSICIQNVVTCPQENRSTESLRDVFIGKCLNYQTVYEGSSCSDIKNCSYLWELFFEAFAHQPPCNVSEERYRPFVDASYHATPINKHIFWSGVYELVSRYTYDGRKRTAIDDTLTGDIVTGAKCGAGDAHSSGISYFTFGFCEGYIGDALNWCGSDTATDGNEVNVTSCPSYNPTPDCPMSASATFWAQASRNFAKNARGSIKIMLNSSRSPAFRQGSFFTTKELPNLMSPGVTHAHVMLVHTVGALPKENCRSKSVMNLTTILTSRGIITECEEQPRDVVLLQCADFPTYQGCDDIRTSGSARHVISSVIALLSLFILIFMIDHC